MPLENLAKFTREIESSKLEWREKLMLAQNDKMLAEAAMTRYRASIRLATVLVEYLKKQSGSTIEIPNPEWTALVDTSP
ncbi:hypothetical protein LCGC14_2561500 [marine sediment metagenome]|uniref:Uncharacterized protein n=1 Tax=marine sediment metagenome TaxID=412755 RepID=A0A0F9CW66_9ZZZZ